MERAVYRGRDQVSDGLAAGWDAWEVFHLEEREVRDLGDSVLWLGRAQMRGGASHVELDQDSAEARRRWQVVKAEELARKQTRSRCNRLRQLENEARKRSIDVHRFVVEIDGQIGLMQQRVHPA